MRACLLLLVLSLACKESEDTPLVAEFRALADSACECKDLACAQTVSVQLVRFAKVDQNLIEQERDNVRKQIERMRGCNDRHSVPVWSAWADAACECSDTTCASARSDEYWKLPDVISEAKAKSIGDRGKRCLEPYGGLTID